VSGYPWNILGIEPTSDELAIQRAYARQLKVFRPDADPEGFADLVKARKHALQYCAQQNHLRDRDDCLPPEPDVGGDDDAPPLTDADSLNEAELFDTDPFDGFSSRHDTHTVKNESTAPSRPPSESEAGPGFSSRDLIPPMTSQRAPVAPAKPPDSDHSGGFSSRDLVPPVTSVPKGPNRSSSTTPPQPPEPPDPDRSPRFSSRDFSPRDLPRKS